MPNMPATSSDWIALAPATLRERKRRSGISGLAIRAWRAMKAAPRTNEIALSTSVWVEPPAVLADAEDRVDAEHQRGGDQRCARDVGTFLEPDPARPSTRRRAP